MANTTVYPYGTGGHLPSSIGLVNDLKTGGVDKALTAEMGKFIGQYIGYLDMAACEEDGLLLVDEDLNIGAKLNGDGLFAINLLTARTI